MKVSNTLFSAIRAAFLVAGTSIGAGMLGIPLVTARYGFGFAIGITVLVWAFMLATGLLLLEASLTLPEGANFLSISRKYLGRSGQWLTGFLFIFLYYFLMIAYVAAGGPLLGGFIEALFGFSLPLLGELLLFSTIFGVVVAIGPRSIDTVNFAFTIMMIIFLFLLFGFGVDAISLERLKMSELGPVFLATPVLFSAFGYHNIIPSLVTYLKKDVKALRIALILGTTMPLVVYLLWQGLIIGATSKEVLLETLKMGKPATDALASQHPIIANLASLFGFFAIVTSVLGVSFSLIDFLADGFSLIKRGVNRVFLTLITFMPPFICAAIDPTIFDRALGIAGGIGEALINGMIPVALVWSLRYVYHKKSPYQFGGNQLSLLFLMLLAVFVFGVEVYDLFF